ncbi:MAG: VCBS repeat-containing protein [Labilithrix sp.]|nr:VCBS repeat-containing protein [Labilithrix sp.]
MNGDGLPDIVRVRHGDIRYWPGRGNGFWGTGDPAECPAGSFGQEQHVAMANTPRVAMFGDGPFLLGDVNGDGLADFVRVRFNAIDVYLNVDGMGWTERHVIANAPPNSAITNRVRLADVNGSGTPDILWGDGRAYRYIDLAGGVRPWVLTRIDNGLGASTELQYTTSVQEMLAAETAGQPWTSKAPTVAHVLSRVTHRDNLERVGRAAGTYVTEYTYRDAVYEGRQREFRGFRTVRSRTIGDANSPTSIAEATFLLGECVEEPDASGTCDVDERWRDNPREALKGLPVLAEQLDENGAYLSSAHTTYRLRRLYTGLDGRQVRHAFGASSESYRYDTSPFVPASSSVNLTDVELERTAGVVTQDVVRSVPLRSSGRARLRQSATVDRFGNTQDQVDHGCVEGCGAADETIFVHTTPERVAGDPSGWIFRSAESWLQGSHTPSVKRNHSAHTYDTRGLAISERIHVTGTLSLDRFHESSGKSVAPPPGSAISDGWYDTFNFDHDAFGNTVHTYGPAGHCSTGVLDSAFAQLVVQSSSSTGYPESTVGLAACGPYELTSLAEYDRGLGVITRLIGPGLQTSTATYDGFGRVTATYRPDPATPSTPSTVPSMTVEYILPMDGVTPVSQVHTKVQDGATADDPSFAESWTYVDGLGRTLATMTQDDGADWIVHGDVDFDAKGGVSRALSNYYAAPSMMPELWAELRSASGILSTSARYDAFGRVVETRGLDDAVTLHNVYHAMSTDAWDAADLEPGGAHEGTPSTVRIDGHGRRVATTERIHVGGQIESHATTVSYLPTGQPEVIARTGPGGAPVVRWMRYDSFGRMVLNVDPNTTTGFNASPSTNPDSMKAWRYAYDRLGQLVGTSDPRGCGTNHFYLADGRPLGDGYSPCRAEHADYSAPDLSIDETAAWEVFVKGDGLEVLYRHDGADPDAASVPGFPADPAILGANAGRVTSVSDRGAKTLFHYDGRGHATAVARRVAKPGVPADVLADRYAPHWYVKEASFDGAGRPTAESTGADVSELLGSNASSVVTTGYSKRGDVSSVASSYGELVSEAHHDVNGLTTQITYGDVAQTSTEFQYDVRHRLSSVLTQRGAPALWSATPPAYTPAPNPGAGPSVFQTVLEHYSYTYDVANNPTAITDLRDPAAWPTSFKPSTRQLQYDDLYRVTQVSYSSGNDDWASPFEEENGSSTAVTLPSPHVSFDKRVATQTFAYDAVGNTTSSDDDEHSFYDRSLGTVTNGVASAGPYQLKQAAQGSGTRAGELTSAYDAAGHLVSLALRRDGPCLPSGAVCSQRFAYEWNEVGQLSRARRWDLSPPGVADDPLPSGPAAAELRYAYAGGERVLKTAVDSAADELHTVYVYGSLELRRARFLTGDYERVAATEVPYLFAAGVRLARVYYSEEDLPTLSSGHQHVLFELPDHLGSASFVIDKETSELVEATRYQAYGATESDYRPDRWKAYRADHRFTGKEEDIEVGLLYFGARYYAPQLNRWISPDPLAVHEPGAADLNLYAYVHGRVLVAIDPFGLDDLDRFWGGFRAVGGAVEAVSTVIAASAACATGVGCGVGIALGVVGVVHGVDSAQAGVRQAITGEPVETYTQQGIAAAAKQVFQDEQAAQLAGVLGDIGLGLAVARGTTAVFKLTAAGRVTKDAIQVAKTASAATQSSSAVSAVDDSIEVARAAQAAKAAAPATGAGGYPTVLEHAASAGSGTASSLGQAAGGAPALTGAEAAQRAAGQAVPDIVYHYTTQAGAQGIQKTGLWSQSSATNVGNYTAQQAVELAGVKTPPTHVVEIANNGQFVLNRPPIVQPHPLGPGGALDLTNPRLVLPQCIICVRSVK